MAQSQTGLARMVILGMINLFLMVNWKMKVSSLISCFRFELKQNDLRVEKFTTHLFFQSK